MLSLRDYQERGCAEIESALLDYHRLVAIAPTGSGKTILAAELIRRKVMQGMKCLFLAHRQELIDQTSEKLDFAEVQHGVIMGKHFRHRPEASVQVASIDTLMAVRKCPSCKAIEDLLPTCPLCEGRGYERSRSPPKAEFIVVDEAHRVMGNRYQELLAHYPNAQILLITATPWRLDGRGLGNMVKKMVVIANMRELIARGYLLPIRLFRWPGDVDLSSVKIQHGDYQQDQLAGVMRQPKLLGDLVEHYQMHAQGERAVVFATNVAHSIDIAARFAQAGLAAEHLSGSMPKTQRNQILARLASGVTRIVSNCDILTEGWDLPSLHCVMLARPTMSVTRYLQWIGRAMRLSPGQEYCLVLDHAGCRKRHGRPEDFVDWSLDDRRIGSRKAAKEIAEPVPCPQCNLDLVRGMCARCNPQAFTTMFRELDGRLVEDVVDPIQTSLPLPPEEKPRAKQIARLGGQVLCSRCRQTWVFVGRSRSVKVTCHKCLESEKQP